MRAGPCCSGAAAPARLGLAALLLIPPGAVKGQSGVIFEDESRYQFIQVVEEEGVRRLYLDEGLATHSVWRRDEVLTGGVWDTYVAVVDLLGRRPGARRDARQRRRDGGQGV